MSTWDDVIAELVDRMPHLRTGDAIMLKVGRYWVQFMQLDTDLAIITQSASARLPEPARLDAERDAALARLGWNAPDANSGHARSLALLPRPVPADAGRRVAAVLVTTLRDVYNAEAPHHVTFTSFNDNGQRAPVLTTVAMDPTQTPEPSASPRDELPDASPVWRAALGVVTGGLGGWSRSDLDVFLSRGGWSVSEDKPWSVQAAGGGFAVWATKASADAARSGFGDFREVTIRREVAPESASLEYRAALAAAVDVLGDPPLVGGPHALAVWRGGIDTVTLSRKLYGDRAYIACSVTPTEAAETDTHLTAKWQEGWRPEYLWLTEPDTDAPEAKTLLGMMHYPHPAADNLNTLGGDLRSIFGSLTADLPLLHPYASDVQWAVIRPNGDRLAAGRFTAREAEIRLGDGPTDRSALNGRRAGEAMAQRLMAALVEAGVQSPNQLRGRMFSGTPAERIYPAGWTIGGR